MIQTEELLVDQKHTKITLSHLDDQLYYGFSLWPLQEGWLTWLHMHRILKVEFQNRTLADVLRETHFTIDDLVLELDETDEDTLCGMYFAEKEIRISYFEKLMRGESLGDEVDEPLVKNASFSFFTLSDQGLLINDRSAFCGRSRSGDSGYDTTIYKNELLRTSMPLPLKKQKNFSRKFIIADPM